MRINKKVLLIFGTRPEAIKMAPVIKELNARENIEPVVCVTAQHRGMLDQVLEIFDIRPDYDLNIMRPNQSLTTITARVLAGVEKVIRKEKPDLVLVHGDTTTSMASALAAFYEHVKVGHVEAGLRTYNKYSPFPEEINRQIIDRIADYLFAPTEVNKKNLEEDLNDGQRIIVTGNTVIDALKTTVSDDYHNHYLEWVGDNRLILLTAHRRENFGRPMNDIFRAVRDIVDEFDDVRVIYPVHLNPRVQASAQKILGDNEKIKLITPLDVIDFHNFMERAYFIMSDSGGVQEEAPSLGKPVLVLRDTTERPEGVEAGTLKLVGTKRKDVYEAAKELLTNQNQYKEMAMSKNPYGDGFASKYIVDAILEFL